MRFLLSDQVLLGALQFARNIAGIILRPYETIRGIVNHGSRWELPYLALLFASYFAISSIVKTAAFRPFLLTKQFMVLSLSSAVLYCMVVVTLWVAGRVVGGQGTLEKFALPWAYTLVPTVVWFLITSLLYVFLPPPRTTSALGVTFSVVYLVFSAALFFWKATLGYLTLRFSMRLDFAKILAATGLSLPFLALYSIGFYKLGIFKVPFI